MTIIVDDFEQVSPV